MLLVIFFNQTISASAEHLHPSATYEESLKWQSTQFDPSSENHAYFMNQIKEQIKHFSHSNKAEDWVIALATSVLTSMKFVSEPNYSNASELVRQIMITLDREQSPENLIDIAKFIYAKVDLDHKNAKNFGNLIGALSNLSFSYREEIPEGEFKTFVERKIENLIPSSEENRKMRPFFNHEGARDMGAFLTEVSRF